MSPETKTRLAGLILGLGGILFAFASFLGLGFASVAGENNDLPYKLLIAAGILVSIYSVLVVVRASFAPWK